MRKFLNKFLFESEIDPNLSFWGVVLHSLKQLVMYSLFYGGILVILVALAQMLSVMIITLFQ